MHFIFVFLLTVFICCENNCNNTTTLKINKTYTSKIAKQKNQNNSPQLFSLDEYLFVLLEKTQFKILSYVEEKYSITKMKKVICGMK